MATVRYRDEWKRSGRIDRVLEKLNLGTEVNSDGNITFKDHDFRQYFDLLSDAFCFPRRITSEEASEIVYRVAIDLRQRGLIGGQSLLESVNERASSALALPDKPFSMWTKLRLRRMTFSPGFKLSFDNVGIQGIAHLPQRYRLDDYFISGIGGIRPNEFHEFGYLIFRCSARNEAEAARKIFDAGGAFFSICSLSWRSISLWTDRHAQANLWMGKYQFFWEGGKFLGSDKIWFNPDFDEQEWTRFPKTSAEFHQRLPYIRRFLKSLESHPLRVVLLASAKLVHEGMASPDLSYRLLRYWSALETLYSEGGSKNVPYDKIIRRAVFAEHDKELPRIKLEHLSRLRNDYVHSGRTDREKNELTQNLRELLATQILYLIQRASDIAQHSEFIEMTDLPGELTLLDKKMRAIERRKRIILTGRHYA